MRIAVRLVIPTTKLAADASLLRGDATTLWFTGRIKKNASHHINSSAICVTHLSGLWFSLGFIKQNATSESTMQVSSSLAWYDSSPLTGSKRNWLLTHCVPLLCTSSTVGCFSSWHVCTSWGQFNSNEASGGTSLRGPSDTTTVWESDNKMTTQSSTHHIGVKWVFKERIGSFWQIKECF